LFVIIFASDASGTDISVGTKSSCLSEMLCFILVALTSKQQP